MGQQVTSLTAEKSLELADENITSGIISGGHLILRRRKWDPAHPTAAGTFIDVGQVVGPTGSTGPSGGSKLLMFDDAGGADDPLGSVADAWYTLASVSVNTGALIVGHKYAVDYYAPLLHPEDLTGWDLELLDGGVAKHRSNTFAPNGGRASVASGTYYFTAATTTAKVFTMRARSTRNSSTPSSVDNSFVSASIAVIDYVP